MAPLVAPRRPANGSQLRADRTRALVIDETIRCILEEGFAAASAKHITERAGGPGASCSTTSGTATDC